MNLNFRKANRNDVAPIVQLLAHDPLGKQRESYQIPLSADYYTAFDEINSDKNQYLIVVEDADRIIGTLQLTMITYLTYCGGKRAQIEGVRIDEAYRGRGIGKLMIQWAIDKARELNCHLVQLTMDKQRLETIEFYKKLGFIDSHQGMKLHLS
ncbi:MAG TPA: GNAT family N-acetyltransferase [Gammaproteobacteria bacterium]|nr:GNAT family N-acetyltransferase [Gammaproteobacteria bacterium]